MELKTADAALLEPSQAGGARPYRLAGVVRSKQVMQVLPDQF